MSALARPRRRRWCRDAPHPALANIGVMYPILLLSETFFPAAGCVPSPNLDVTLPQGGVDVQGTITTTPPGPPPPPLATA
jgi:hypothetical protein